METNNDKYLFKRGRNKGRHEGTSGFAIFLILFGGIYLLLNIGIIPSIYKPLLISWQMLLIGIGIWSLIKRKVVSGICLIAVGVFFIYSKFCAVFPEYFDCLDIDVRTYWPVLLIFLGIMLIVQNPFFSRKHYEWKNDDSDDMDDIKVKRNGSEMNSADFIDKNIMFGSSEQIVLSQNFRGGEGNVMFGELVIDLRKAKLAEGTRKLAINVMFGSAIVYVPSDWAVEIQSSTVFGSIEDKRDLSVIPDQQTESRLIIKASAMFGGAEIRY
ncbi:MAG: LiaI-LiaF-like domain-containing protein [Dysgonomonas sp.]